MAQPQHTNNPYDYKVVHIDGSLVERYNQALDTIGVSRTSLQSFDIDLYGWSPQIAEEKGNNDYLSHGDNLPYGIIISSDQKDCSLQYIHTSMQKKAIDALFEKYSSEISSMILWTPLIVGISIDSAVLLSLDNFSAQDHTGVPCAVSCCVPHSMINNKTEQDQMISKLLEGDNILDENMLLQLVENAKKSGDLREKSMKLPDIVLDNKIIYTKNFGGVYVIYHSEHTIMVFKDPKQMAVYERNHANESEIIVSINDPRLLPSLKELGICKRSMTEELLDLLFKVAFAQTFSQKVKEENVRIADIVNNIPMLQKYFTEYTGFEWCNRYLTAKNTFRKLHISKVGQLADDLGITGELYSPITDETSPWFPYQDIMWQLITDSCWYNVTKTYQYNPMKFMSLWSKWSPSMQEFISNLVK